MNRILQILICGSAVAGKTLLIPLLGSFTYKYFKM